VDDFLYFCKQNSNFDFCLVNDGSTDNTLDLMYELHKNRENKIKVLDLGSNYGKAEAIRRGVLFILEQKEKSYDYIGYFDADFSTPLSELIHLLENGSTQYVQMILGSRVKMMGHTIQRSAVRYYFGRVLANLTSLVLGLPIHDIYCGAKLIRPSLASKIFESPFFSRWLFDTEILLRSIQILGYEKVNLTVKEVPLKVWIGKGNSTIRIVDLLKGPFELLRIYNRYNRKNLKK
jgi:glycosyltransferase involved in cell wall biosynthesis